MSCGTMHHVYVSIPKRLVKSDRNVTSGWYIATLFSKNNVNIRNLCGLGIPQEVLFSQRVDFGVGIGLWSDYGWHREQC